MRPTLIVLSLSLVSPAVWGEYHRRPADQSLVERSGRSARTLARRAAGVRPKDVAVKDAAPPQQAPGVVQINLLDASHPAWFVATDVIPKGSTLTAFLVFPDNKDAALDVLTATSDIQPGQSIALPGIHFGDFWPLGITSYEVDVNINGTVSVTTMEIPVGDSWAFADLPKLAPLVTSTTTQLTGGNVVLAIRGVFTGDPVYVAIEDIVVPRSAIQVGQGQITVNLGQVEGFDLASLQDLLLTVGQNTFCDTAVYRYVPQR